MLMMFSYFLNHMNLPTRFATICRQNLCRRIDIKICRKNNKFVTIVYRKLTFSGVFTNYESFIPTHQKRGLLHTLPPRSFSICCDFKAFHFENVQLRLSSKKKLSSEFHMFVY